MNKENITYICKMIVLVTLILSLTISITYYHLNKTPESDYSICISSCKDYFYIDTETKLECVMDCNKNFNNRFDNILRYNKTEVELIKSYEVPYTYNISNLFKHNFTTINYTSIYEICNGLIDKNCTQW